MSIEQRVGPVQPDRTKTEKIYPSPKEISKEAAGILDSFEEYIKIMELRKKRFTEYRVSDGWEWEVEFDPGKTKSNRSLMIKRREEDSESQFSRVVVGPHYISFFEPDINQKGTPSFIVSPNNYDAINQATEFVETFIHSSETESR